MALLVELQLLHLGRQPPGSDRQVAMEAVRIAARMSSGTSSSIYYFSGCWMGPSAGSSPDDGEATPADAAEKLPRFAGG